MRVYDRDAIARYYRRRPWQVIWRSLSVFWQFLGFILALGWDRLWNIQHRTKLQRASQLRELLTHLGPTFIKVGQALSTRPDLLQKDYLEELTKLQDRLPPFPNSIAFEIINRELDRSADEIFRSISPDPIAAASLGQVYKAQLRSGETVAVKVQRPGLTQKLTLDLHIIRWLCSWLAPYLPLNLGHDLTLTVDEFGTKLFEEIDYLQEGRNAELFSSNFQYCDYVKVPSIYWRYTSRRVLTLEWIEGYKLTGSPEFYDADLNQAEIIRIGVISGLQQLLEFGFFHADPHPGNWFYLDDGRVALLDCGMMGRLDPRTQEILLEIILAIVSLDSQRCAQLTLKLAPSDRPINLIRLESDYEHLLRHYYSLSLTELNFSQLFYQVLQIARQNRIQVPGNLGLCAKCIANLEGVARSLDPEFNFPNRIRPLMADLFQQQLVGDAPLPAFLRTLLDLKSLGLRSPRQVELLLDRLSSETLRWNLNIQGLDRLLDTLESGSNRLSFSIITGSLILGSALLYPPSQGSQLAWFSIGLLVIASILGFGLIGSILWSSRGR